MRETGDSRLLGYVGLFSSMGTLVCCALPSLLVLLGFGATVASLLSAAPWLVTLSRHKTAIFAVSALVVAGNYYYVYRIVPRVLIDRGACAADNADACAQATLVSRVVLWCSMILIGVGLTVAYLVPVVLERIDS